MDPKLLASIEIPLVLSAIHVNVVLKALSSQPFNEVAEVINSIKAQGDPVVQKALAEAANTQLPDNPPAANSGEPLNIPLTGDREPPAKMVRQKPLSQRVKGAKLVKTRKKTPRR